MGVNPDIAQMKMGYVYTPGVEPIPRYVMTEIENSVAHYDVRIFWSYDQGKHWMFAGEGRFFDTVEKAESWIRSTGLVPWNSDEFGGKEAET